MKAKLNNPSDCQRSEMNDDNRLVIKIIIVGKIITVKKRARIAIK